MAKEADGDFLPGFVGLLVAVALGAVLRLLFGVSFSGNDDVAVSHCALRVLTAGLAVPETHYCARWGLTLPLAAIYGLFGTGAWQISLVPALASLLSIVLAWALGRRLFGPGAGLAAALAMALFPMAVKLGGIALPDALQSAILAAAVLCLLPDAAGRARPLLGGVLWAWGYYVKLDAFVLGFVLLLGALLALMRWRDVVVAGGVALALVGVELAAYALATGSPLHRIAMESRAAEEMLAPGADYRNLLSYPRAMFLQPTEAGLHYILWAGAGGLALWRRSRPALLLLGWGLAWQAWLTAGADPFAGFRLKPQISRYLMSWAVPMCVLAGWAAWEIWRRSRAAGTGVTAAALALALLLGPFNMLSFEDATATRAGLRIAQREALFPLYADGQSHALVSLLLHGRPEATRVRSVQRHDFLRGETRFAPVEEPLAFLLLNQNNQRRLAARSLVQPVDPHGLGREATEVARVDNPMPRLAYAALDVLERLAGLLPTAGRGVAGTAASLRQDGDAIIWRLDAP